MEKLVTKYIESVKPYVPGKPIEEVKREHGVRDVIKLASNENCLGPSPKAVAAMRKALSSVNRYPDAASYYLKQKLAIRFGVKPENIVVGNGSDENIALAVKTFVGEGDEVVIAKPTFLIYEIASHIQGARIISVPLTSSLKYDLRAMKRVITPRTKMVFIANPDNPTGSYVSKRELDAFFKGLPAGVIVFLDEAYYEFACDAYGDYPNGMKYLKRPRTIVARTFSKAYGLAGLRIGYSITDAELAGYMERAREPFNINLLAQAGALAALDDGAFLRKTLAHVRREKAYLAKELAKRSIECKESATNFVIVNVRSDCKEVFTRLLKKGVIVRDMKAWGLATYIRVTIGTRNENARFVAALECVIDSIEGDGKHKGEGR